MDRRDYLGKTPAVRFDRSWASLFQGDLGTIFAVNESEHGFEGLLTALSNREGRQQEQVTAFRFAGITIVRIISLP